MESLDLHNTNYEDAKILVEDFILKNYNNLPIEIITGNSLTMINILKKIVENHNLRISASHLNNLGSYIINNKLN